MANTVWITQITNNSDTPLIWRDGENGKFNGIIGIGQTYNAHGKGLCFPWVDHTKKELWKAIDFVNGETGTLLFCIFQSYNRDTIQWITDENIPANHAVDVAGDSQASGSKALFIGKDGKPGLIASK